MIVVKQIDATHQADIHIPNQPFELIGKFLPSYQQGKWSYEVERFAPEDITTMCFPDEEYSIEEMSDSIFLGAYDGENCIGLAILQPGFFKYMYLYDLKVNREYRGQQVGRQLIEAAKAVAIHQGYKGLYTQGQDNNLAACLFYMNVGFEIGGLDTKVYEHTAQEGKADVIFYCEG